MIHIHTHTHVCEQTKQTHGKIELSSLAEDKNKKVQKYNGSAGDGIGTNNPTVAANIENRWLGGLFVRLLKMFAMQNIADRIFNTAFVA